MDFSRFKKAFASVSVAALTFTQVGTALAYSDVPSGVWFEASVNNFVAAGHLDSSQARFRGGENATRAEFVKLVVSLNGGVISTPPAVPSFDDVPKSAWYFDYFEEAGIEGWVRGDGDCYGSRPCFARPNANVNRAEASALIVRSFALDATGAAPQFVDNPSGQWYTNVVQTSADHCVLQGDDGTGRVRPGDNMNRAEMVVMLDRADQNLQYGVDCGDVAPPLVPEIDEVEATSATTVVVEFNVALDPSVDEGMFTVANGTAVDVVGLEWINDRTVELWLGSPTSGDNVYTVTANVWTADGESFSDSMSFSGYRAVVTGDGVLEVSLSSNNPVGDTVPQGAIGVVFMTVDLTASCDDDIVLDEVTVVKEGLGDEQDIDGVYVMVDQARLSRKRTIDSDDQTADLRLSSPLVINRCDTANLKIVGDIATTAQAFGEHNFVVQLPSDVRSNAKSVNGNFPLRGDTFRVAAVDSGNVTVEFRTVTPNEVEVGDKRVVVGKFQIEADSVEDQTLYSITLENDGSASDGDFVNIALRRSDGTVVTNTVFSTASDYVTLEFEPPLTITEGDKLTFEAIADIVDGAGDTVKLQLEEESDLFAVGALYGFGVNGQLYGSRININATNLSTVTIDAGEFTISIDGPSTRDYTNDDDDAVLANIIFQAGGDEPIDVKDIFMMITGVTSTGAAICANGGAGPSGTSTTGCGTGSDDTIAELVEDVEIRNTVTGRTIDGVRLTSNATDSGVSASASEPGIFQIYRFDDFVIRGKETWEFRVDFIDNGAGKHPQDGDEFKVIICVEPTDISSGTNPTGCTFGSVIASSAIYQMEVEGLSTGDKVLDVRPGNEVSGNSQRIAAATLQLAQQFIGTSETTVRNAKDVNLLRFEARASEAEDILLTQIVFQSGTGFGPTGTTGSQAVLQSVQNYTLWADTDGDKVVDTIVETGRSEDGEKITFDELNDAAGHVIPRNKTVVFEVHGDVASNIQQDTFLLEFAAVTNIEAEQLDDNDDLADSDINLDLSNASKVWLLRNQGNLYVTRRALDRQHQLLGGTTGQSVLNLEFRAEDEDVVVEEFRVTSSGNTATSVESLALYISGESTPFEFAEQCSSTDQALSTNPNGGGTVKTFCATLKGQELVVPEDERVQIQVRPKVKKDDSGGTFQTLQFFVGSGVLVGTDAGRGSVRAIGLESNNDLNQNDADSAAEGEVFVGQSSADGTANDIFQGQKNVTVFSKFSSIVDGFSFSGSPGISGVLGPIGSFRFTAATNSNGLNGTNEATLSGLIFNVNASNVTLGSGSFKLYNQRQSNEKSDCEPFTSGGTAIGAVASGAFLVVCDAIFATIDEYAEVPSGGSETFILEGEVTNPKVNDSASTLLVSLNNFNNFNNSAFSISSSHVHWIDKDDAAITTSNLFRFIEHPDTTIQSTTFRG